MIRRLLAFPLALALTAAVVACADDDGDDPPAATTSTTSEGTADGSLEREVEGRPSAATVIGATLWVASDSEASTGDTTGAPTPGALRSYDATTGVTLGSVPVGPDPVAVVPLADALWTIGATGVMTKVDVSGDQPTKTAEVDLGAALVDGVVLDDRLWVADIGSGLVHVLDPETGEAVADPVVVEAGAVRLAAAGEPLWVSGLEDQVTPIDVADGVARQPVTVGKAPIGLAIAGDVLWVANSDDDTVSRISLESGQPIGEALAVGNAPVAIAIDGQDVWVLDQDEPSVHRLDAATGEPIGAPVELPMRPRGMALSPDGIWVVGVDPSTAVLIPSQWVPPAAAGGTH